MLQLDISPRQTGKTTRMINDMVDYLWTHDEGYIGLVSPNNSTSVFIMTRVGYEFGLKYKRSGRFTNPHEIDLLLARCVLPRIKIITLNENLRGFNYRKIYIDEYSYVNNSLLCDIMIHNSLADYYITGHEYHHNSEIHFRLLRDDSLPDNYFDKLTPKPFDLQKLKFI